MFTTRAPPRTWSKLKIATVALGSVCIVGYNPIKNSFAIDYFVKKNSLLSGDNKLVKLPLDLHELADDIRKDARIKEKSKNKIKFFLTKELDTVHFGNLNMTTGTQIGIPYTYIYEKVENVDTKVVSSIIGTDRLTKDDWYETERGKKLINSLVLSKEAKKFAIIKEIMAADSEMAFYQDMLTLTVFGLTLVAYEYLEPRTISAIGKWPTIILLTTVLSVVCISLTSMLLEMARYSCMKTNDTRAIQHPNEDFKKGALEYYEKLIERNKSLRGLLVDGPDKFDPDGNQISWFQINFSSLKERMDHCKKVIDTWVDDSPII